MESLRRGWRGGRGKGEVGYLGGIWVWSSLSGGMVVLCIDMVGHGARILESGMLF